MFLHRVQYKNNSNVMWDEVIAMLIFVSCYYISRLFSSSSPSEQEETAIDKQVGKEQNAEKKDVFIHEKLIGDAKLTYDGKVTLFESSIVKFSVTKDRQITTDDIQLLDPTAATVRDGNLHIHDPHFHIVVLFQDVIMNNANSTNSSRKRVLELRLYDDINNRYIKDYKLYATNHSECLYCAKYDAGRDIPHYYVSPTSKDITEQYIRITPRHLPIDYLSYKTVISWYSFALYERDKLLITQKKNDDVRNMFGLVDNSANNIKSTTVTPLKTSKVPVTHYPEPSAPPLASDPESPTSTWSVPLCPPPSYNEAMFDWQ